ncbi:MAG: hypothetical protein ACK4OO_04570 [bacterium]
MRTETRRGLRFLLHLVHIAAQLGMIWYLVVTIEKASGNDIIVQLNHINSSISHLGVMCGVFFIYYTLYRLLSRPINPDREGR